ncbi:DUF4865 family protein [Streptomyces olivaceiscleroticus]|uniref:DUF4865 family protein n=1 Tax=Streptomyces olivaceiscleroticus TaxID=68245 RepID=A0ABN0ZVW3_9ACTN
MYAAQYEITLPADHDMGTIRKRVAATGHLLDDRAGLALKAYLVRERGVNGSPVNQYAPFYLWQDTGAMGHFLLGGGGFQNIVRDFGRPAVRHWTGAAVTAGPARGTLPRTATRRLTPLPAGLGPDPDGLALGRLLAEETAALRELARHPAVHTAALAVDPHHWQLLRLVLGTDPVPASEHDGTDRYEVLHLSAPHLTELPEGHPW